MTHWGIEWGFTDTNINPITAADVNGDGKDDFVGFADDGVALDAQRGLLYVSEVWSPTHTVLVYNVSAEVMARELQPSGVASLDDFTLSRDGEELYGADFLDGRVVAFPLLGESPSPQTNWWASVVASF